MSTVKITDRGTITIPKQLRSHLPDGALVEVVRRQDGVLELRPQLVIDATQAWFWHESWQQMEREVDEDISAGRIETFDDVESFLADLDAHASGPQSPIGSDRRTE